MKFKSLFRIVAGFAACNLVDVKYMEATWAQDPLL